MSHDIRCAYSRERKLRKSNRIESIELSRFNYDPSFFNVMIFNVWEEEEMEKISK